MFLCIPWNSHGGAKNRLNFFLERVCNQSGVGELNGGRPQIQPGVRITQIPYQQALNQIHNFINLVNQIYFIKHYLEQNTEAD